MPDQKPFLALKNLGIQADPDPMMQFRSQHPWLAGAADILTGGATDPYHKTGLGDVASAVVPAIPLGRLGSSLDYVTGVLKDAGYGSQAAEANPAIQALVGALDVPSPEASLAQHIATSRVTGKMLPPRQPLSLPEGVAFKEGFKLSPRGPESDESKIWRTWSNIQKRMQTDPRLTAPESLPEVKQMEMAPTTQGIEELQNLPVAAAAQKEQAPLQGRWKRNKIMVTPPSGRVPLSKATPEDIKAVQRAAGSGMNNKMLAEKFPQFNTYTLQKIVKLPWKD